MGSLRSDCPASSCRTAHRRNKDKKLNGDHTWAVAARHTKVQWFCCDSATSSCVRQDASQTIFSALSWLWWCTRLLANCSRSFGCIELRFWQSMLLATLGKLWVKGQTCANIVAWLLKLGYAIPDLDLPYCIASDRTNRHVRSHPCGGAGIQKAGNWSSQAACVHSDCFVQLRTHAYTGCLDVHAKINAVTHQILRIHIRRRHLWALGTGQILSILFEIPY